MIVMLIIRTYALYERNKKAMCFMVIVAAVVIAVGCVRIFGYFSTPWRSYE